ncbi:TonB-dependent hemoglobin/transferrin/lactoferrin family receptor [Moritella sp. 24]|uniref:TonB-dependent hemoglobin/transferrin/lactoferrin family receptor n=1 Tax=Moritella sp. 24 TaxID=2746230 RepID=UPI001BACFFEB|nr:TonB-dependent hemoglobin/transferrin/lactoferrin family receptor [Moritella sp. 24]QUM76029.1 TonB-dependent hemoglobin/transferrin/lactoferrin family receptor [Moritella sp. 24]
MSAQINVLTSAILLAISTNSYAAAVTSLDEVVVSATRTEQSINDVSSSISSVSADSIDSTMAADIKETLKATPGVSVNGSGRFGMSGINIRGMDDSRVKIMVDGVAQPVPYNPGSNEQRKFPSSIEVDTLQSIEVNKGPSSTLYGSDALGGAVVMRTKNPDDVLKTKSDENAFGIKTGYKSVDNSFKTTGTWAMRKDKLETLVMLTYKDANEYQTHSNGADINGPDRGAANPADQQVGNLLAKAFYQLNDQHRVGLITEYYTNTYDEDELSNEGYKMMPGYVYTDNYNEDLTTRLRIGVEHEWVSNNAIFDSLDWKINFQKTNSLSKNYDTTPAKGSRMRERDANDESIQFDAQFDKLIELESSYHEITYGASFLQNDFSTKNVDYSYLDGTSKPGHTDMPDATLTQWGMFVQDQGFYLDERLIVTAGLRYDSFDASPETNDGFDTEYVDSSSDAFTAKLGSVYHFTDNFSGFAQISQGFKAPTVYDLYYFYNTGAIVDANPDLKPESSVSYEMGIRTKHNAVRTEFVAFYNDYTDLIAEVNLGKVGNKDHTTKDNIASAEIYGVEFSSTLLLDEAINAPEGMYTKFSIAYLEGYNKDTNETLDTIAPLTSDLGLGYDAENGQFGSLLNINMVASKDDWADDAIASVSGYAVVDVTAYYRPMTDVTLTAGLFNAFDKQYWLYDDVSSVKPGDLGVDRKAEAGRNWGVTVDWKF